MFEQVNEIEICDQLESLQNDMNGLTDLLHLVLEGIRTDSVGIKEIINAVAILYNLSKTIANQVKYIHTLI